MLDLFKFARDNNVIVTIESGCEVFYITVRRGLYNSSVSITDNMLECGDDGLLEHVLETLVTKLERHIRERQELWNNLS